VICSDRELEEKVKRLAQWIRESDEKNRCSLVLNMTPWCC
jgi:hypothetical protein